MPTQKTPPKIIKDNLIVGKYFCPSDDRTYEITHIEKTDKQIVVGHGLDCKTGKGLIRMSLEEFKKKLLFKSFIKINPTK